MKTLRYIFFIILLTAATTYVYSQSWDMFFDKGKEHYDKGNYEKAIENLELYLKYETTNPKAEAKQLLESAHKIVKQRPKEAYFIEDALGLNMKMIYVEGGTFLMGAPENDKEANSDEKPQHQVTLDSYYIAEFEVTQSQWEKVMETTIRQKFDESGFAEYGYKLPGEGTNFPMYYVSWEDVIAFCQKLSEISGKSYQLPTEAQWEYAARGGIKSKGYKYSGSNNLDEVAWHPQNSEGVVYQVGLKIPNELGLYDMNGNVYEWCQDLYGDYSYEDQYNPIASVADEWSRRVFRGGDWYCYNHIGNCRLSWRGRYPPTWIFDYLGFRVVCIPE